MSTTNQILVGTFVVLIVMWLLVYQAKNGATSSVISQIGSVFAQGVGALAPKQ